MPAVTIVFNGERRTVESSTVAELLRELQLDGKRVAVEQNRQIVPRAQHDTTQLAENDSIEIVHFVGGG